MIDFPGSPPPQTGSITIVKTVVPTDPQDFSFTTTGSGLSNFILDDDSVTNLEARATCLVPATLYSRMLARTTAAA